MAVQLILKNSSVQDKEVTANQVAVGEVALNYHSSGPFLQCKDTNGDVWRLGGVIIGTNAPSSPAKGAWWFNAATDVLQFYDGSAWNEIFVNSIVDGDIDANAEIAVSKLADGAARQLLQTDAAGTGVEWTSNVDVPGTLDVTGVATFDDNVVITGNLTVNGTTTTIDTTTLVVEDKNIEMGAVGTPTDTTADGGGLTLKGATDKTFNWVNSTDSWTSSENVDLASGKTYKVNGTDVLSGSALGSGVTGSSLTGVGTITSGIWNGTTIATGSGGTGQTTYSDGQLLIGKTDGTLAKATLTAGTNIAITNSDGGIEIATSGAGINNVVEDTTPQLGGDLDLNSNDITGTGDVNITGTVTATSYSGDGSSLTGINTDLVNDTTPQLGGNLDVQTHAINTSTTNGDIDLDANGSGLIQVTEFNLTQVPIVTQHDIGTAANEVPLNGMLGGMAFQDPASVSVDQINGISFPTAGTLSNRNLIINGAMQVAQRGTSGTTSGHFGADRFYAVFNGGAMTTSQESLTSGDPYDAGFRNFVRLTNTTAATGAANHRRLVQLIEAQNIANSGWNYASAASYVTLSFWVRSSVSQEFFLRVASEDGTKQNYPMSTGTLSANTWTKVTKTIPGNSSITVDNNNGAGLKVEFAPFFGTDYTDSGVTVNAWAAYSGSTIVPDMTSTWAGTTNATFDVTGVQLEVGQVATPFEHRSYGDELQRCMRYCEKVDTASGTYMISSQVGGGTMRSQSIPYTVAKRAAPTITFTNTSSEYIAPSATGTAYSGFTFVTSNTSTWRIQDNAWRGTGTIYAINGTLIASAEL